MLYFSLKKSYPGAKIYWCSVVITDWKIETRMSLQDFAFSYDFLTFIIISLMCVLSTLEEFFDTISKIRMAPEIVPRHSELLILASETCQMVKRQILINLKKSIFKPV